jgi:hypothetical protein
MICTKIRLLVYRVKRRMESSFGRFKWPRKIDKIRPGAPHLKSRDVHPSLASPRIKVAVYKVLAKSSNEWMKTMILIPEST